MLTKLLISNYALIDALEIDFRRGLTIITGETGAGKSIILGALALILGDRADANAIRNRERKTVVEASFNIDGYGLRPFFEEHEIDDFGNELIVRREIAPNGRSRAFVNDGVTQLTTLRELMTRLVDIHSQHSNMLLSRPAFQLDVLDNIADNEQALASYKAEFKCYKDLIREIEQLKLATGRDKHDEDYLRFQLEQLSEMELKPDEDAELEARLKRLSNASDIKENLWQASAALNGSDSAALSRLAVVENAIESAERNLDEIDGMTQRVKSAIIELRDIAATIDSLALDINDDPRELEAVEKRLDAIYSLEKKHSKDSVNELIQLHDELQQRLDNILGSEQKLNELEQKLSSQRDKTEQFALALKQQREKAAKKFMKSLMPIAHSLGMSNLQGDVLFSPTELSPTGCHNVEFRFAFNKNQPLMPVKDTASGGEISRLMLCIKALLAQTMALPTIIFDEVDTGVSGEIAAKIGQLMGEIGQHIQVVAITHLPQVAAHGRQHLRVYKTDNESSTVTSIEVLDEQRHITEIARMLSGNAVNDAAIANAKALIDDSTSTI